MVDIMEKQENISLFLYLLQQTIYDSLFSKYDRSDSGRLARRGWIESPNFCKILWAASFATSSGLAICGKGSTLWIFAKESLW